MFVYKIQDNESKRFATGGRYSSFVKIGKVWSSQTTLNQHLSMFSQKDKEEHYRNCSVVKYDLVEVGKTSIV